MDYHLKFNVNDRGFEFDVSSKSFKYGKPICKFESYLFNNKKFLNDGYIIEKFPKEWTVLIKKSITNYIKNIIKNISDINLHNFSLERYHNFVDDELHKKVISKIKGKFWGLNGIHLNHLGIPYNELDVFVNDKIKSENLSCHYKRYGLSLKHFWIRIIRPNSLDNNPPHKDGHVNRINKNVNIYLPLAGSNKNSSLPIIPKTHLEKDDEYIISKSPYLVNGKKFTVPCIVYRKNGLNLITPNPKSDEIMIFTPWLIHGGGVNSNSNLTRVSLEMRFFYNG
jgi:hypothetical protein